MMKSSLGCPQWSPLTRRLGGSALWSVLPLLVLTMGCAGSNEAIVYIDNGTAQSMSVKIDDGEVLLIPASQFDKTRLPVGEHRFVVYSGKKQVFDGTKNIEPSKSFGRNRYLFNPDFNNRYAVIEVQYGDSQFGDVLEAGIRKYVEHKKGDRIDETKLQYRKMLKKIAAMPMSPWFEIASSTRDILQDAPETVTTDSSVVYRDVLTRVSRKDHSLLRTASEIEEPVFSDLVELAEISERVYEALSDLDAPRGT